VDNGGFFPEEADSLYRDKAWFLMDSMVLLGTDASGMSEKELKYGRGWLLAQLKRTRLPMVCANVWDKQTKKTLVPPYLIVKKGSVNVGVFGLTSDKVDLGPARDSLTLEDPAVAAKRSVEELRKKGATVVVLLSQLGKVESEDLVTGVDGIDVVIAGRNVPVLQKGRMIKNTVACYGGEQGQNMGRTIVTLDAAKKMQTGENDVFVLGPEVGEKPEILTLVKSFNDAWNDKMRKLEKERAAQASKETGGEGQAAKQAVDHYVGSEVCQRCHQPEYDQWKSTGHAKAWQTLVDAKKEATPECIQCHVVGYKQAGGFQTGDDAPKLGNVQCEMCHGMGTTHEAMPTQPQKITAATCITCHTTVNSPPFTFDVYEAHILHHPPASMPPLPPNPAMEAKKAAGH
jgi:mono/diheme cytochrome c family protein